MIKQNEVINFHIYINTVHGKMFVDSSSHSLTEYLLNVYYLPDMENKVN